MALPLKPGLTPSEVAFLCEMELVRIIPEEKLQGLDLLGGRVPAFNPPFATRVPLWLAILLKRQRKARLVPPPWLSTGQLSRILETELQEAGEAFSDGPALPPPCIATTTTTNDAYGERLELSPPFTGYVDPDSDGDGTCLPYHWLELAHLFLTHAADNIHEPDVVGRLVRDLREARIAKVRRGTVVLDAGAGVKMNGVGALEVAETRAFVTGVIDGLRTITASREQARKERDAEQGGTGGTNGAYADRSDDDPDDDDDDDDDDNAL